MTNDLFARNWAFVDPVTQSALNAATVLTAGTGLGSLVAVLAARTGFGRFILADGDCVDRSNLNRQAFFSRHLGVNKAVATAEMVRDVRSDISVLAIPEYLTEQTLEAPIAQADIVINTIDFDDPVFIACNRIARSHRRTVLLPINLGWGAALYAFGPDSPALEEVLAAELASGGADAIKVALVLRALGDSPHAYLAEPLRRFLDASPASWPADPQLGVAASVAAALTVTAAVQLVRKEPIRLFPEPCSIDVWASVTPMAGPGPHHG